jgi:hypothetical protein
MLLTKVANREREITHAGIVLSPRVKEDDVWLLL